MSIKALLLLHAILGVGLVSLSVHLMLSLWAGVKGKPQVHTARKHSLLVFIFAVVTILTGALIYPAFRVNIRAGWMDAEAPALTGLFEIKEHFGAVALLLAFGLWWHLRDRVSERLRWSVSLAFTVLLFIAVLYSALSGLYLVSMGSV